MKDLIIQDVNEIESLQQEYGDEFNPMEVLLFARDYGDEYKLSTIRGAFSRLNELKQSLEKRTPELIKILSGTESLEDIVYKQG